MATSGRCTVNKDMALSLENWALWKENKLNYFGHATSVLVAAILKMRKFVVTRKHHTADKQSKYLQQSN